jgi:hypothetical protein
MAANITSLPVEILVEIFKHLFDFSDGLHKTRSFDITTGEHVRIKEVLELSLFRLLGTSKLLYRVAEEVFYSHNTLILNRIVIHYRTTFGLPNPQVRPWVKRVELRMRVPTPSLIFSRQGCGCKYREYLACPHSFWAFLHKLGKGEYGFVNLRHVKFCVDTKVPMAPRRFEALQKDLQGLCGISIPTRALAIELEMRCIGGEGSLEKFQNARIREILERKVTKRMEAED